MDRFGALPDEDRGDFFRETSERMNLEVVLVEKDFWVCWALKQLYELTAIQAPLFRGGTSLSKCFSLITRFSEDVDLTLDPSDLDLQAPVPEESDSQKSRRIKRLRETCRKKVHGEIRDHLEGQFESKLGSRDGWELVAVEGSADPTLAFSYPP